MQMPLRAGRPTPFGGRALVLHRMNQLLWTQQDLARQAGLSRDQVEAYLLRRTDLDTAGRRRLELALQLPAGLLESGPTNRAA